MDPMTKTIVVPLHQKIETTTLLRQLHSIVNPGDRIELLVEHREMVTPWVFAQVVLMQTGLDGAVRCEEQRSLDARDDLKQQLEREVALPARRMFSVMDVHVNLNFYTGSLRRLFRRYLETSEVAVLVGGPSRLRRPRFASGRLRNWLFGRNAQGLPVLLVHSERLFLRS